MSNRSVISWTIFCGVAIVLVGLQFSSRPGADGGNPAVWGHGQLACDVANQHHRSELRRFEQSASGGANAESATTALVRPAVMSEPLNARPIEQVRKGVAPASGRSIEMTDRPISQFAQVKARIKAEAERDRDATQARPSGSPVQLRRQPSVDSKSVATSAEEAQRGQVTSASVASREWNPGPGYEIAMARSDETVSRDSGEIELVGGLGDERDRHDESLATSPRVDDVPVEAPWQLPSDVEIKVAHHLEYGKSLARRGALYSAELEFLRGLRLISQSIDRIAGTKEHTLRLDWALQLIREADELARLTSNVGSGVDLRELTAGHANKIFSDGQLSRMTSAEVIDSYREFAVQNLVFAGGRTIVAGEATFCLGKLNTLRDRAQQNPERLDRDHAILFHRVALQSDSRHDRAANELGVLYAETGRMDQAKAALIQSLRIRQRPETWANLAVVHERLGERRLAQLAAVELQKSLNGELPDGGGDRAIKWLPPEQFARQTPKPIVDRPNGPIGVSDQRTGQSSGEPNSVLERTAYESEREWR